MISRKRHRTSSAGNRVIVIGAGCAGITAALTLQKRGYRPVLLERSDDVGGMSKTAIIDGQRYELGTVIFSAWDYAHVRRHIKKHGLSTTPESIFQLVVDANSGKVLGSTVERVLKILLSPAGVRESLKYAYFLSRYSRQINADFNSSIPPALQRSFSEEFPRLADAATMILTGFGYSYAECVSTFQVMKYLRTRMTQALISNSLYRVAEGNQRVWQKAAERLDDVHTGVRIKRIHRRNGGIEVVTAKGVICGDQLVFAIAPHQAVPLLEAPTGGEQRLAAKVQTTDYRTYLVKVSFPWNRDNQAVYLVNNMDVSGQNKPMIFYYSNPRTSDIATVYVIAKPGTGDRKIEKAIKKAVAKLDGTVESVAAPDGTRTILMAAEHWDYFPMLSLKDIRNDSYKAFAKLQGKKQTYHLGQFWSFPTVEHSASNAESTIIKYFPVVRRS